ncbi:MAG: formyltetrahydrofolate deformylase [Ignavibacteria bacterium]|nr:formyltetrahydrofolate deformylase [Ignavibacteria bacterium]
MAKDKNSESAILLIHCEDKRGIVASVSEFINKNDGNIIFLDQHVDYEKNIFFMRVEWELSDFRIPKEKIGEYFQILIGNNFNMKWDLHFSDEKIKMAIFVSKQPHCLYDILSRYSSGEWKNAEIPLIISNHPDTGDFARKYGIDFHHFPVSAENKIQQEKAELNILKEYGVNLVVLARYMQVVSADFINEFQNKIINIHHSFLPAFPGAKPYHSAYERGVKIIGATSHYVTSELDAGPIIEQDVCRVSHKDSIKDMVRKGRDLENVVLSRAIWAHLNRKVLAYENRTVVF